MSELPFDPIIGPIFDPNIASNICPGTIPSVLLSLFAKWKGTGWKMLQPSSLAAQGQEPG